MIIKMAIKIQLRKNKEYSSYNMTRRSGGPIVKNVMRSLGPQAGQQLGLAELLIKSTRRSAAVNELYTVRVN